MPVLRVLFERGGVPVPSTGPAGRRFVELFDDLARAGCIFAGHGRRRRRGCCRHGVTRILEGFVRDLC